MNKTMSRGKKGLAEKTIIQFLTITNQQVSGNSLLIFHQALNQLKPVLTVISRRIGRRIYQVPVPLETLKQYKTSLK
jgi:small subunit ribosomal protein S7